MNNYTNYLETITNGTNIYQVYEVITNVVVTQTNFITETNTVTSLRDPALWITIAASLLTAISAFLMWRSVSAMKKQNEQSHNNSVIMTLIQYDQQLISAIDDLNSFLAEIFNNNKDWNNVLRNIIKLSSILKRLITIYYSKLYENNDYLKSFFNELINPSIKAMINSSKYYYDNISKKQQLKIRNVKFIQYCKEQKIDIPDEILIKKIT